ncbi:MULTISPECIES: MAG6450 family protein [Clostridium]|uniref:MAG6450 family protein n=1 Tax=Clostridium TaxID=1485 RepID=UPI0006BF3EED|nr:MULTISPECIES: hypothetical protein [Clostridium]MDU2290971.1 hypothetical protein [Clostridium celatum]CUN95244.1 Uncharacterised protein [Clostridium disporicum]
MAKKIRANTSINKDTGNKYSLSDIEAKLLGVNGSDDKAFVVLKHFDSSYQCFSEWKENELRDFSNFIKTINQMTWSEIYKSGGKSNKTGLGYTVHTNKEVLPNLKLIETISEDITFFELRVSKKARVHGFRVKSAFYLVWLDRGHKIYPM